MKPCTALIAVVLLLAPPDALAAARNSVKEVACGMGDTAIFCALIKAAAEDPVVAQLSDVATVATVFAPTDRGFANRRSVIEKNMGELMQDIMNDAELAAELVRSHVVLGDAVDFRALREGLRLYNELETSAELEIMQGDTLDHRAWESIHRIKKRPIQAFWLHGPVNTVRVGFQDRFTIKAGAALVHIVEDPIVPHTSDVPDS